MLITLTPQNLPAVVRLHRAVLGHTLNSRLGAGFLTKLYTAVLQADTGFGFGIKDDRQVLVGFIVCCLDQAAMEKRILSQLQLIDYVVVAWFYLIHPWLLPKFIRQRLFMHWLMRSLPQPHGMVLTIGVDPNEQGKGYGRELIQAVDQKMTGYYLDTEQSNSSAIGFYKKIGFNVAGQAYGNVVMQRLPVATA